MTSSMHRWLVLSALLLPSLGVSAQDGVERMPEDVLPFWNQYYPAKLADDEPEMDKSVRLHPGLAEKALDLLIDDVSLKDDYELHDELRTLAWSMDRAQGQTRFIERVRFVLDLDFGARRQRRLAVGEFYDGMDLLNEAAEERSESAWTATRNQLDASRKNFERLGDVEWTILCLRQLCEVEVHLGRPWERGQHLKGIVLQAKELAYRDIQAEWAEVELAKLLASGIDPDAPKPEVVTAGAGGESPDRGAGRGLTSYAPDSTELVFELEQEISKKGIGSVGLPTFNPVDQFLLWPHTFVKEDGPTEFDALRPLKLQPFGATLMITRDGTKFGIDSNGDGEADVVFSPSTNPRRVDIPSPDGDEIFPLLICIPGDREQMFGMQLNYSPQPSGARLRFGLAFSMEAKVLGTVWKLYDSNLTGRYGDPMEFWDDRLTDYDEEAETQYFDLDSVLIGKAKKAVPWSSILPVGDGFYRAQVSEDGKQLKLREMHLQTGFVKLDAKTAVAPEYVVIREVGKLEGAFFDVAPKRRGGVVEVPVGTYQFDSGRLAKGKKTSMKQVRMIRGHAGTFEVRQGETHVLELGAPYRLRTPTLRAEAEGMAVVGHEIRVWGRGGEEYRYFFDDVLQPTVEARTAEGKKLGKPERMRIAGVDDWQTGKSYTIWFPLDLLIEVKGGAKVQVRMTQKSHPLLGGPFESDWTP